MAKPEAKRGNVPPPNLQEASTLSAQQEKLLAIPRIGDILRSGGQVRLRDLPLDLQNEISTDPTFATRGVSPTPDSFISLPRRDVVVPTRKQPNIKPFTNLQEVLGGGQPLAAAPVATPTTLSNTPVEQGQLVSGGLDELLTRIQNLLRPATTAIAESNPFVPTGTSVPSTSPVGGAAQLINLLFGKQPTEEVGDDTVLNRLLSNVGKTTSQGLGAKTLEQGSLDILSKQFPELAGTTQAKGLAKFKGAGEFRVSGNRYKIDNSGRIVKVG